MEAVLNPEAIDDKVISCFCNLAVLSIWIEIMHAKLFHWMDSVLPHPKDFHFIYLFLAIDQHFDYAVTEITGLCGEQTSGVIWVHDIYPFWGILVSYELFSSRFPVDILAEIYFLDRIPSRIWTLTSKGRLTICFQSQIVRVLLIFLRWYNKCHVNMFNERCGIVCTRCRHLYQMVVLQINVFDK